MSKKKFYIKIFLLLFSAALCLTMGILTWSGMSVVVYADSPLVRMIDGASIRVAEPYGMRFSAEYSTNLFDDGTLQDGYEAGILLVKTSQLEGDLVIGTEGSKDVKAMVWDTKNGSDGFYRLNAVIINVPEEEFGTFVTARAYLKHGDEISYTSTVSRNVAQVASRALADGYNETILQNYVNKVEPSIALPDEVSEKEVTLLAGQTISYSVSPSYLTAKISVTNEGIVSFDGANITATVPGTTDVTLSLGSQEQTFTVTVVGGTNGNVSLENTYAWRMEGSGTPSASGNVYTTDYYSRNALMFDMNSSGEHVLGVTDYVIEAVMPKGEYHPSAGGEARGGVLVYAGARWMVLYYYSANLEGKAYFYDGSAGWLKNDYDGDYLTNTFREDAGTSVTIRVEKIKKEIRFFANNQYLRTFKEDAWENAFIGLESKYTARSVTVNEYKTIDEFSAYSLLPASATCNMTTTYNDGVYTFAQSSGGYWTNALTNFDGGSFHLALLDNYAKDYTFETKVKLSSADTASGITGVMGFWVAANYKSWLEIDKNGTVNVYALDGTGFLVEKALTDFGLTTADEIPVEVIKKGTKIEYYINGIKAYEYESSYYNAYGYFGFFGISPAAGSEQTGQYGAEYKIVGITVWK